MQRERTDAGILAQGIELYGEQDVRGLRLAVRLPLVVALLEVQVVPTDVRTPVPGRRDRRPRAPRRPRRAPARAGSPARSGRGGWSRTAPPSRDRRGSPAQAMMAALSIMMSMRAARGEELGRRTARTLARSAEIQLVDLDIGRSGERFLGGVRAPRRYDDVRAGLRQGAGGLQAEAGVATGDERRACRSGRCRRGRRPRCCRGRIPNRSCAVQCSYLRRYELERDSRSSVEARVAVRTRPGAAAPGSGCPDSSTRAASPSARRPHRVRGTGRPSTPIAMIERGISAHPSPARTSASIVGTCEASWLTAYRFMPIIAAQMSCRYCDPSGL